MKDCESVCEGAMVAAVNCNEIMLDIPSQERTSSPGQKFCSCTKMREISVFLRSTNDPTISHLHQTTLAFANPKTGVGEGSRSHRVESL